MEVGAKVEIVSWLPVKSILRFRCVKKSWSTLFQNLNFIAKHLHHQTKTKNPSILVQSSDLIGGYGISLHPYPDDNDDVVVGRIVDLKKDLGLVIMQQTITINMFSCINGIICIGGSFRAPGGCFHSFVLWNPAIRERKIISYPSLPGPPSRLLKPYNSKAFYAFGYDQYSNDYKVVRIVTYNKDSPPTQKSLFTDYHNFFQVFSLKAPFWAPVIDTTLHRSNIRLLSPCYEVYFNGAHHWLGFFDNGHINQLGEKCDCEIILSFDMSHEVFRIMKLPDEVFRKLRYPVLDNVPSMQRVKDFCVFNDRLAFVVYKEDTVTENYFDIWVMREDSWTKQLVVGPVAAPRTSQGVPRNTLT